MKVGRWAQHAVVRSAAAVHTARTGPALGNEHHTPTLRLEKEEEEEESLFKANAVNEEDPSATALGGEGGRRKDELFEF